ncbi:hypothetical protein DL96DRAFT_1682022 [Flagelloscypha sp. PMI_526]|nr:hypothetical protein DL96DRAFT_1682022 [Flagelloscypha sp. PMI_526]
MYPSLDSTRSSPCLASSQVLVTQAWSPGLTHKKDILGHVTPSLTLLGLRTGKFLWTLDHLKLEPNSGGVWIRPLPLLPTFKTSVYLGVGSLGYWQTSSPSLKAPPNSLPEPDEKVLYHVQGGSFTSCSDHLSDTTPGIPCSLLQLHTQNIARSFNVEYRLASTKPFDVVHPFPTALIDCLSGYHYLFHDAGYREENIIVVGDLADYDIYEPSPCWPQTAYLQPHGYGIADFNEYVSPASLLLGVRLKVVGSYRGFVALLHRGDFGNGMSQ